MAIHSSILAWEITWSEEPGRLQSIGHDLATKQQYVCMADTLYYTAETNITL